MIEEEKACRGVVSVKDIAPALESGHQSLDVGRKVCPDYFRNRYPRYITVGWFAPIINLNTAFTGMPFIQSSAIILKQLKNRGSIRGANYV